MGLMQRLFGGTRSVPKRPEPAFVEERPDWMRDGVEVEVFDGRSPLDVVGESNYQDALRQIVSGRSSREERVREEIHAILVAERDNPYDPNAISVWVSGLKVGYLSRADAERYRPGLLALEQQCGKHIALRGAIAGGGIREDGPGLLGVFLDHDPKDFGLRAPIPRPPAGSRMDTGLSEAMATDADDDSYDLSWVDDLPDDPIRAIAALRRLLEHERDPIDRHYMFDHLEKELYKSRDAFASALDEYDECCHRHDAEMEIICAAFLTKWGQIPRLHTYKQMCIRHSKAGDFAQALQWAERGLALYGDKAARLEAVEDLQKRAERCRRKCATDTLDSTSST